MTDRNYFTVSSAAICGAAEDDPSDYDAEALGFLLITEHYHCSEVTTKTETCKIFERPNCSLDQRQHNTEQETFCQQNEKRLFARTEKVQQETLKSLERSLRLLHESEETASSTAQVLLLQREQLERTERRLDEVHGTLKESKKVIRNLQGVLGGVTNYIAKKCRSRTPSPNKRSDAVNGSSDAKFTTVPPKNSVQKAAAYSGKPVKNDKGQKFQCLLPDPRETNDCTTKAPSVDELIEKNLGDMSISIQRLQDFAVNLNAELRIENELINRLIVKADGANSEVDAQTKEVAKIDKRLKWF